MPLIPDGTRVGPYTVVRFLGGGGFGQAYLVEKDGRELVAKRYIHDDADAEPEKARQALQREALALTHLRHPGLPTVIDYFAADEQTAFLVMTRMPGRPLDEWLAAARAADADYWKAPAHAALVRDWALSLAEALGVLHNLVPAGLVHLDIKPENVLVRDDGKVSLIDFGAVRTIGPRPADLDLNTTVIAFSAGFVAPEYERSPTHPRPACDIYSAGVLLRVMLTGTDPRDDPAAVLGPLPPTGEPLWDQLAEVAAKAHAFLPEERYATAADLTAALLELAGGGGRADGACRRCRRRTRRASVFCAHCGRPAWADLPAALAAAVPVGGADADRTRAAELLHQIGLNQPAELARFRLFQRLQAAGQDTGFNELQCLDQIKAEKLPHQTDAALRALRDMGGFALLADEVGLGKTIEAGIILKELVVRGMAYRVLVIVPDHVLDQWQQELYQRFGEYFLRFGRDVDTTLAWKCHRLLVPYQVAEDAAQGAAAAARDYDLVIFDEAHHLLDRDAQRGERLQRFARRLGQKARRLLMLTATPMLSDLRDLHTLLTLLKPGSVGDLKAFLHEYRDPAGGVREPEKLRKQVESVMIRNTRQRVPRMRFLTRVVYRAPVAVGNAGDADRFRRFHTFVARFCRRPSDAAGDDGRAFAAAARELAGAYHSSPEAFAAQCEVVLGTFRHEFERAGRGAGLADPVAALTEFRNDHYDGLVAGKVRAACDILTRRRKWGGKFLVFTQYHATAKHLCEQLNYRTGLRVERYPAPEEDEKGERGHAALLAFREAADVLVCGPNATEGLNLQAAHSLINFDLPPDPMKLEQRIGRVQRFGQKQPRVFVWNLYLERTYEQVLLDGLEDMLATITTTIGEHEQILGNLARRAATEDEHLDDLFFDKVLADDAGPRRLDELLASGEEEQSAGAALMGALYPTAPDAETAAAERAARAYFDPAIPGDDGLEVFGSRGRRAAGGPRCPVCGTAVAAGAAACPTCQQPLSADAAGPADADPPAGPVMAVAAFPPCPHCRAEQTRATGCCQECGEDLAAPPCPACGAARTTPTTCCTECGEEFKV